MPNTTAIPWLASCLQHADGCFSIRGDEEHCCVCGAFIPEEDVPRDLDFEADMAAANSEEPDYEAIWQAREEARAAARMERLDRVWGVR